MIFTVLLSIMGRCLGGFEPARVAIDLDRPFSGYAFTDAFPGMAFNQPVGIATIRGDTNRLFVIERSGVIWVITDLAGTPKRNVFLDLTPSTQNQPIESGLLGLAFHPQYAQNGQFFVFRTVYDRKLTYRLSRYSVSGADPNRAGDAETILIDHADRSPDHNAGDLHFGPDGYLYVSVGDTGPMVEDVREIDLPIDGGLFGGILRIDVDERPGNLAPTAHSSVRGHYLIPADNPFVGATSFLGLPVDPARVRTEFYALGLRNPWRFSFDELTGDLLVGDVGNAWAEEINLIKKGRYYGWPFFEGSYVRPDKEHPPGLEVEPALFESLHGRGLSEGSCIIGGIVCRNSPYPDLEGWYIFGDETSGNIRRMRVENPSDVQVIARDQGVVAFGRNPATREILVASVIRGEIRRLVYVPPEEERVPSLLSNTGVFSDLASLTPAPGVEPFEINVPFWSDHAIKRRWFGLMDPSSKIDFSAIQNWGFPHGAVWVKHFELEMERGNSQTAKRIETRLLVKTREELRGFTYRWSGEGGDAQLVGPLGMEEEFPIREFDGQVRTQRWNYPPRGDCLACHTKAGGGALGFNTAQLNLDQVHSGGNENQLEKLVRAGYLRPEGIVPQELPALAKAADAAQPLEHRVKSFLAANCVQCHQPGGAWGVFWDARLSTPMSNAQIINGASFSGLDEHSRVVAPGSTTNSILLHKMSEPTVRMPPLGSTVLDDASRGLIRDWILGLPDTTFNGVEVGDGVLHGSVSQRGGVRVVSGIGAGMAGSANDRLHLLSSPIDRGGHVVARLKSIPGSRPGMKAGVMVRSSANPDAAGVWLARNAEGRNMLIGRGQDQAPAAPVATGDEEAQPWMRLVRNGDIVTAWESLDGSSWEKVGETDFVAENSALAGLAVASGENWRFSTAEFDELQTVSVAVRLDDPQPNTPLPRHLWLEATVQTNGVSVSRVDFFADDQLVGSADTHPYRFAWTNAWTGEYDIVARAIDQNGLEVDSEALRVEFTAEPPVAQFVGTSQVTQNWREAIGLLGEAIPEINLDLPPRTTVDLTRGTPAVYALPGKLPGNGSTNLATAWVDQSEVQVAYRPGNEIPHKLTLFFARYNNAGTVRVTLRDLLAGTTLDERIVTDFENGTFVSWVVRGAIDLRITSDSALAPSLSGLFIDSIAAPTVRLLPVGSPILLPASVRLQAEASAEGPAIARVEFWDGDVKLGEDAAPPFEFDWDHPLKGVHPLAAVVVDEFGSIVRSAPVEVLCELRPAAVTFLGEDRLTQGDWIGPYGDVGQIVPIGWTNLPTTLSASITGPTHGFTYFDTNRAALRWSLESDARFAGCYFTPDMNIDIATLDGRPKQLSLYFLDWLGPGRRQEITLLDGYTGTVLDRREIGTFYDGTYLCWNFEGHVRVDFRSLNDFNAIVNAIFFDTADRPASFWLRQKFPGVVESEAIWNDDPDADGRPNYVEYALGSNPFALDEPVSVSSALAGGYLTINVTSAIAPSDAGLFLETSTNLLSWQPVAIAPANTAQSVQFTVPDIELGPNFYRLRFTVP